MGTFVDIRWLRCRLFVFLYFSLEAESKITKFIIYFGHDFCRKNVEYFYENGNMAYVYLS